MQLLMFGLQGGKLCRDITLSRTGLRSQIAMQKDSCKEMRARERGLEQSTSEKRQIGTKELGENNQPQNAGP